MPETQNDVLRTKLNETIAELDRDFDKYYRRYSRFLGYLGVTQIPLQEIHHAWLADFSLLKYAVNSLSPDSAAGRRSETGASTGNDTSRLKALTMVSDYLSKAGRTRELGDAWSCVNLATAFLVQGIGNEDLRAAAIGLLSSDKSLTKGVFNRLKAVEKEQKLDIEKHDTPTKGSERNRLFTELMLRSYVWDGANRRTSLRIRLFMQVGIILIAALVAVMFTAQSGLSMSWYFAMPLLGAFGGSLSATITARKSVVDAVSYRIIVMHLLLRVLMGAAGGFVIYLIVQWPGLINDKLLDAVNNNYFVFLSLGIASGFSERLFIGSLEKISDNLSINSEERQPESGEDGGKSKA